MDIKYSGNRRVRRFTSIKSVSEGDFQLYLSAIVCCSLMPTLKSTGNTRKGFPSLISSGSVWKTSRGNGTSTVKWSLNATRHKRQGSEWRVATVDKRWYDQTTDAVVSVWQLVGQDPTGRRLNDLRDRIWRMRAGDTPTWSMWEGLRGMDRKFLTMFTYSRCPPEKKGSSSEWL